MFITWSKVRKKLGFKRLSTVGPTAGWLVVATHGKELAHAFCHVLILQQAPSYIDFSALFITCHLLTLNQSRPCSTCSLPPTSSSLSKYADRTTENSCFNSRIVQNTYFFSKESRLFLESIQPFIQPIQGSFPRSETNDTCSWPLTSI